MFSRTAAAALWLTALAPTAYAQVTDAGSAPGEASVHARDASQTPAGRRDGAILTHANEQKPKAGHSETSAGKSGK